tara:strand:- start:454 stop:1014 length:561 start_codon:yes stop_codon:yes gene_type:complete
MKMKESALLALLREEVSNVRKSLSEDNVELSPGGNWSMDPPIVPDETALPDVGELAVNLVNTLMTLGEQAPEEAQEALGTLTGIFDEAGMLDAMCATTQGRMGFREDLKRQIAQILREMDDPEFGFGPENEPMIDYPKRRLDVEDEAAVNEVMQNAVHRAKMSGMSKEDLAELFTDAVYASYEETA